jgi:uncharacterized protein YdaU (DUF1376 family)
VEGGVNYYPHHIGDYAQDTRHLTMLEHGAYRLLLDLYYSREAPLPLEVATVQRLACARAREEKQAVEAVLREFFVETPEGWRHARCDREIEAGRRKQDAARENGKKGGRKPTPRQDGTQPKPTGLIPVSQAETQGETPNPNPNPNTKLASLAASAPAPEPSPAVRLAIEARQHGLQVTGSDPRLIAAAEQGVTPETLRDVIAECARRKGSPPPIGYVLATLQGWAADAAEMRVSGAAPPPSRRTALDAQADVLHRITGGFHGRAATDTRTIDAQPDAAPPRIAAGSR